MSHRVCALHLTPPNGLVAGIECTVMANSNGLMVASMRAVPWSEILRQSMHLSNRVSCQVTSMTPRKVRVHLAGQMVVPTRASGLRENSVLALGTVACDSAWLIFRVQQKP